MHARRALHGECLHREESRAKFSGKPGERRARGFSYLECQTGYFGANSPSETPEFEIGVRYRENGIVEELIQDYGTYTIVARLDQLEIMPFERC